MPADKPSPTPAPAPASDATRATARPPGPPEPAKPVRMGRYEIVKHIATGGMGRVLKARDPEENRDVALKVLDRETAAKPAMLERFRREGRSAMKLAHENVVTVFDTGE